MNEIMTLTSGFHIINGSPIVLEDGAQVSFRRDVDVRSFETESEMHEAHREAFPEWYQTNDN
ncbi:MAG: hypothetical protein ACRBCL_04340 [Maritimibacter sp.]